MRKNTTQCVCVRKMSLCCSVALIYTLRAWDIDQTRSPFCLIIVRYWKCLRAVNKGDVTSIINGGVWVKI